MGPRDWAIAEGVVVGLLPAEGTLAEGTLAEGTLAEGTLAEGVLSGGGATPQLVKLSRSRPTMPVMREEREAFITQE
jgi:hypothetical protein